MIGCGGGGGGDSSSGLPTVDNSILADGSNEYGYFGVDVIFGGIEVTGDWNIYNLEVDGESLYATFYSDGTGEIVNSQTNGRTDVVYGVSKDGRVLDTSETIKLTITGVNEGGAVLNYNNETLVLDCYYGTYSDWIVPAVDVEICPSGIDRFL